MNPPKPVICPERLRTLPPRFSWIDQRLVQARHLDRLDVYACALYLFLTTVANAKGLSWYGDEVIARRLSVDPVRLRQARAMLIQNGLLAFADGVYQVLALDDAAQASGIQMTAVPVAKPAAATVAAIGLASPSATPDRVPDEPRDTATARCHLATIRALLERHS